ncbi:unnamed protein product [Pylaiella littoralis]
MKLRWKLVFPFVATFLSTARGNITSTECVTGWIGDSICDGSQNNSECEYDGGDCCECDCEDTDVECGGFEYDCVDPSSACYGGAASASTSDSKVPVGTIVGGVAGGVLLAAAAVMLALLLKTGRLKACKCCRPRDPASTSPRSTSLAPAVKHFSEAAAPTAGSHRPPAHRDPPGERFASAAREPATAGSASSPPPPSYESARLVQYPHANS